MNTPLSSTGGAVVATGTPPDLAQWRKGLRAELVARRLAAPQAQRDTWGLSLSLQLLRAIPWRGGATVGFCWPHQGEFDARPLMQTLRDKGLRTALPVIERRSQAMQFRGWGPGTALEDGPLGIPRPVGTEQVDPQVLLIPLVGFGAAGDRLGYGGGYFDRTLAALEPRPLCVGVGFELSRIASTFPQAHDVPMDAIVTESALYWRAGGLLKAVNARELREKLTDLAQVREQTARLNAHTVPGSFA